MNLEPAEYIQLDLFPAEVSPLERTNPEIRAIVSDTHFYVFEDTLEGPQATEKYELVSFDGKPSTGYTVETTEGVFHIIRQQNCGCGSRLRGFHPFAGVPHISQTSRKKV